MIPYAPNEGSHQNMEALRARGWRLLLSPYHPAVHSGFRFAIDNGAWRAHQNQLPFDGAAFEALIDCLGCAADFVIIPDIVAGGKNSLDFSVSWLPKLRNLKHLLLPIQDGMTARDVGMILRQNVKIGLFLGGSTEFKLREMYAWGMVAHAWNRWYHVGRVNTIRRIRLCSEAGADSFDGSGVVTHRYSKGSDRLPGLDAARAQPSLFTPARLAGGGT